MVVQTEQESCVWRVMKYADPSRIIIHLPSCCVFDACTLQLSLFSLLDFSEFGNWSQSAYTGKSTNPISTFVSSHFHSISNEISRIKLILVWIYAKSLLSLDLTAASYNKLSGLGIWQTQCVSGVITFHFMISQQAIFTKTLHLVKCNKY